ncbi:ficolin-2-like [Lytechinus variegatus]|uniref:ficolin-2-like n=1 Tax=Lytechinus variegatus TaxID=7654 RepID=UPI001BB26F54|nr:ficolin-2-like [Lytechinus variegatus]
MSYVLNGVLADNDVVCPEMAMSCPHTHVPDSDEVVKMVPKRLPSDHQLAGRPELKGIDTKLICSIPDCLSNPCLQGEPCVETYDGYECQVCPPCTTGNACKEELPKDCSDHYDAGKRTSGVYSICLGSGIEDEERVDVYCDLDGGDGWLVIQRRHDGSVDFYRDWASYKNGFGDRENEFWLGNDIIHRITYQATYRLRIEMVDLQGNHWKAKYDNFRVGSESELYRLGALTFWEGSAGDALSYHVNSAFYTYDRDTGNNCAMMYKGGWWYNDCHHANLNGLWSFASGTGMAWNSKYMKGSIMAIKQLDSE